VVVINRGARDGLAPGNVLGVFELGGYVPRHGGQRVSRRDVPAGGQERAFAGRAHRYVSWCSRPLTKISLRPHHGSEGHHSRARPGRESLVHWKKSPAGAFCALSIPGRHPSGRPPVDQTALLRVLSDISFLSAGRKSVVLPSCIAVGIATSLLRAAKTTLFCQRKEADVRQTRRSAFGRPEVDPKGAVQGWTRHKKRRRRLFPMD